jgi:hypothetical protein
LYCLGRTLIPGLPGKHFPKVFDVWTFVCNISGKKTFCLTLVNVTLEDQAVVIRAAGCSCPISLCLFVHNFVSRWQLKFRLVKSFKTLQTYLI